MGDSRSQYTLVAEHKLGMFAAAPSACQVGEVVKAKYDGDGLLYDARIAHIFGDTITVSWNDGDPHGRHIPSKDVYKNGVSCALTTGT